MSKRKKPSQPLVAFIKADRQWSRQQRLAHARFWLGKINQGVYYQGDAKYNAPFWNAVIAANSR